MLCAPVPTRTCGISRFCPSGVCAPGNPPPPQVPIPRTLTTAATRGTGLAKHKIQASGVADRTPAPAEQLQGLGSPVHYRPHLQVSEVRPRVTEALDSSPSGRSEQRAGGGRVTRACCLPTGSNPKSGGRLKAGWGRLVCNTGLPAPLGHEGCEVGGAARAHA